MKAIILKPIHTVKDILLLLPRIIMTLIVMLPITCLFIVVIILTLALGVLVALLGPLGFCHIISQI